MLPRLSCAMLPIQRLTPSLGAKVPCWASEYDDPERRISYHRTPAMPGEDSTVWLVTSDSYPPKLRYARRKVGRCRLARLSSHCAWLVMPGCGRQSRPVGPHGMSVSNESTG